MKEAAGTVICGPNLDEWPARLVDVFVILQNEFVKVENQRAKVKRAEN